MDKPATFLEKIQQAHDANCMTIDAILKSDAAWRIDIEIDPATRRVKEIRKCKVEKAVVLNAAKPFRAVPFPKNALVEPARAPLDVTTGCTFDNLVERNAQFLDQARHCERIFKGVFLDEWMKVIHENICALQPLLEEYHSAFYEFDPDQAEKEVRSLFDQLGKNYSVDFTSTSKNESTGRWRFIGECEKKFSKCYGRENTTRYICSRCMEIMCNNCDCSCVYGDYSCIDRCSVCTAKPPIRMCNFCKNPFCNTHSCTCSTEK